VAAATAATPAYGAAAVTQPTPSKGSGGRTLPWILAAIFAVAAIGLGIWAFSLKSEIDDRDDQIDQLTSDSDDLDSQLSALKDGQESTQKDLDAATATANSLTEDLATAQSDLATQSSELETANAKIAELEAQLEAATATTTTTTTTTLPPDTAAPADPQEDGTISADEFAVITQAAGASAPAGFTVEQAQDIANQACAAPDAPTLTNVVLNIQATYLPAGTTTDAAFLTGAVASQACYTHIQALAGS